MKPSESSVLVAGGSSGLGAAVVQRLQVEGAKMVVADLRPPRDTSLEFIETDVTSDEQVRRAVSRSSALAPLRAAVICAGVIHGEKITGDAPCDLDAFRRVIEVNLVGTFNVLRCAAQQMRSNDPDDNGERGVIITTSSVAAFEGQIGQSAYSASKGGVASMTLPAARELGRYGIRVVSIAPGVFDTPMMSQVQEEYRRSLESQIPFPHRFGHPAEFAAMVFHILENPMLNGSVLRLDGAIRMTAR